MITTLSPKRQQQPNTCSVSTVVAATFVLAVIHLAWSLSQTSQLTFSITSIQNHHYQINNHVLLQDATINATLALSNTVFKSIEDIAALPSKWFVTEEQRQADRHAILREHLRNDARPFVSIVVLVKSKPEWKNVNDTSLHTLLIPSILKTITPQEWDQYHVELLVGFDVGDPFWENSNHRLHVQQSTGPLLINFLALRKRRPTQIPFNAACRAAYELGADYIVRINDDTEFLTPRWITQGVQQLRRFRPPRLGVVGPRCDQGNVEILTHDMVHRLHLDIFFVEYYPDEFDNWWIDDWISTVYGRNNTRRIDEWEVYHHVDKHGTRYRVDEALRRHLATTVKSGRDKIRAYLWQRRRQNGGKGGGEIRLPKDNMTFQVIGSHHIIPAAWGPSVDRFYNRS